MIANADTVMRIVINLPPAFRTARVLVRRGATIGPVVLQVANLVDNDGHLLVSCSCPPDVKWAYDCDSVCYRDTILWDVGTMAFACDAEKWIASEFGVVGHPDTLRSRYGGVAIPWHGLVFDPDIIAYHDALAVDYYWEDEFVYLDPFLGPATWTAFGSSRQDRVDRVKAFLAADPTDTNTYTSGSFVCSDFAAMLRRNALAGDIPMYVVGVGGVGDGKHTFNAVLVGDSAMKFDDWFFIEPQDDGFRPEGMEVHQYFSSMENFRIRITDRSDSTNRWTLFSGVGTEVLERAPLWLPGLDESVPLVRDTTHDLQAAVTQQVVPNMCAVLE
jgi:hypothetical protein